MDKKIIFNRTYKPIKKKEVDYGNNTNKNV